MSVAVVNFSPLTCSGEAYSGVKTELMRRGQIFCRSEFKSLAMPKSSSFTFPSFVIENIRRLQIAVNDEILMCKRNRRADFAEKIQTFFEIEIFCVGKFYDRFAFDIFHHEKRQIIVGRAAVNKMRDVRMFERGENLPFVVKTLQNRVRIHSAFDEFERDFL